VISFDEFKDIVNSDKGTIDPQLQAAWSELIQRRLAIDAAEQMISK
jgi:hypothetical protein